MAGKLEGEKDKSEKSMDGERDTCGPLAFGPLAFGPLAFGPLDIKRHLKDDGRTLILYTLREHKDDT